MTVMLRSGFQSRTGHPRSVGGSADVLRVFLSGANAAEPGHPGRRLPRRRTFLIIDPQALVRHGLALMLERLHPGALALEAADTAEAQRLAGAARELDLALLDLDGLAESRLGQAAQLVRALAPVPVIVASARAAGAEAQACVAAGARAFVRKTDPTPVLEHAIALVLSGEPYVCMPRPALDPAGLSNPQPAGESVDNMRLTGRQREIFDLLLLGCSNKEIARRLGVLEGTVKVHVRAVMQKLGVRNRTQVAVLGTRSSPRLVG